MENEQNVNLSPPFYCFQCNKPCGGRDLPAAWNVRDEDNWIVICDPHYQKMLRTLSPPEEYDSTNRVI